MRERVVLGWQGQPKFTEHSYRSFAADGGNGDRVVFQNIDYTHAEWTFWGLTGEPTASARGRLEWPWGSDYAKPQPIRVCYPNVSLRGRTVHFIGVSDITEPNPAWRGFKRELTGKEWDYDFRRLFYTWTPDITREPFRAWVEVASRERTCGWISPGDLYVSKDGAVHVLWMERALDERLRARFFPGEKQSHALHYAQLREGRVVSRRMLLESTEDRPGPVASAARFHALPDGRLLVIRAVSEGGRARNELVELRGGPEGAVEVGVAVSVPMEKPFVSCFTATPRAGCAPSETLDLLGVRVGTSESIGYARIRIGDR